MIKPSYLQMVKDDMQVVRKSIDDFRQAKLPSQRFEAEQRFAVALLSLQHAEECLDCAVAALQDAQTRAIGDFQI